MANNTIAQRFTETVYATRNEVKHELRTPLVDSFWKGIVSYRNGFNKPTGISHFDHTPINYCLCPTISSRLDTALRDINSFVDAFNMLSCEGRDRKRYQNESRISILNEIAKHNELEVDDKLLSMILDGNVVLDNEKYNLIDNYARLLNNIPTLINNRIDEDLIATIYARLTGSNELTSLYRTSNDTSAANKVIIDRIYESAPYHLIPGLMSDLFQVLNSNDLSSVLKASIAYYYICSCKPFYEFNEEMALLITKIVLAKDDAPELMANLNLERLFTFYDEKVKNASVEVQKNYDLTYFLDLFLKLFEEEIDKEINHINHISAEVLKDDYYKEAIKEAKIEPEVSEEELESDSDNLNEEENVSLVKEELEKPVEVAPKLETKKEEVVQPSSLTPSYEGLAINPIPVQLDERQIKELTNVLLETDPELKENEAIFFAKHCTMGRRYTIAQFKREIGCAYETARTSMAALAELGYYREEMVKNKKVYTPIKRK